METAAVQCSPSASRLVWVKMEFGVVGQAGPCMGPCMGGRMAGWRVTQCQ